MTGIHQLIIVATVCMIGLATMTAKASPIIDGRFDAGEGYTYSVSIAPSSFDANKNPGDSATMYFYQDTNTFNLSVAVSLPTSYVDNSYGTKSVGWNKRGHTFRDLLNSDKAVFQVNFNHTKVLDFSLDYLYQPKNTSDWLSGVNGNEGSTSDPNAVLRSATSMAFNMNLPGASAYTENSPNASSDSYDNSALIDWVFEATYEFEIDGDVLGNQLVLGDEHWLNGFELFLTDLHASPSKGSEFRNITPPPPSLVPEPSSASLMGLAMLGLLMRRRRLRLD